MRSGLLILGLVDAKTGLDMGNRLTSKQSNNEEIDSEQTRRDARQMDLGSGQR